MIVGIDPGITGAIAWLEKREPHAFGPVAVIDMPVMQRGKTSAKQQVNAAALATQLRERAVEHVYLEHVMGAPRKKGGGSVMGAASAFNFGHTFGVIEGVLGALAIPYTLIMPGVWKIRAGLKGAEKDMSRTHAVHLFPHIADWLQRKKDVGRAEAMLIGYYGATEQRRIAELGEKDPFGLDGGRAP